MSLLDAAGMVTGDIWCNGAFSFESPLKDLLDTGVYTLEQLLAEDELLQELRGVHPALTGFLSTEEAVAGLIRYIILPPEEPPALKPRGPPPSSPPSCTPNGDEAAAASAETETDGENPGGSSEMAEESPPTEERHQQHPLRPQYLQKAEGAQHDIAADPGAEQLVKKEPGKWLLGQPEEPPRPPVVARRTEQEERDARHVRYPYMACEVLCCEVQGIIDVLVDGSVPASVELQKDEEEKEEGGAVEPKPAVDCEADAAPAPPPAAAQNGVTSAERPTPGGANPRAQTILDLLFSILYESRPGEIDDYRAGYFDKVLSVLFRRRPQAMTQYMNEGGGRGNITLMSAMFKHLYSHSIMQIIQRLLLPQTPLPPKPQDDGDKDDGEGDGDELFSGTLLEGTDMDGLGSFRCNWSELEASLEMLLDCLIGDKIAPEIEKDEELKLSLYQNASEVLITIIQNSPLTSPTLHLLTTDPVTERLILAAAHIEEGTTFSNHDSRLTCAMNVLESLILQLGGYGSVGTMIYPEDEEEDHGEGDGDTADELLIGGSDPIAQGVAKEPSTRSNTQANAGDALHQRYATSETLVRHLPTLLSSLGELLRYSGAENWVSQMQFSRTQPQKILGSSRLRIVRLLESLVLLGDPIVDSLLCESQCLEICLDLFWKFQWCSMLHQSVANLLVHVFEGQNARSELQSYFLVRCNLLGRLMDSFWEGTEEFTSAGVNTNDIVTDSVMGLKDDTDIAPLSSVAIEKVSSDDVLPVSDDDVDAAMEQQEASSLVPLGVEAPRRPEHDSDESRIHGLPEHTPPQSFRLGYMGHVIIICQALVHACTNDGKCEERSMAGGGIPIEENGELDQFVGAFDEDDQPPQQQADSFVDALERGRACGSVGTDATPSGTLILAQLVESHSLSKQWQLFVSTTLASETAIQSTPLGGFHGSSRGMDPLHAHRPGLADDGGYDDDDGAAPPLPPRGLLIGGDVIDMDDNDLDVAASMMAGMSLARSSERGVRTDQDMLAGIQAQSSGSTRGGYVFDDPLGDGRFGKFDDDDDSSSDEESELSGNTGDSGGAASDGAQQDNSTEPDAPVMDLFAGNFDAFGDKDSGRQEDGTWSDFANFDDAFGCGQASDDDPADEPKSNVDSVFGDVNDHAILLEELDNPPVSEPHKLGFGEGHVLDDDPVAVEVEAVPEQPKATAS